MLNAIYTKVKTKRCLSSSPSTSRQESLQQSGKLESAKSGPARCLSPTFQSFEAQEESVSPEPCLSPHPLPSTSFLLALGLKSAASHPNDFMSEVFISTSNTCTSDSDQGVPCDGGVAMRAKNMRVMRSSCMFVLLTSCALKLLQADSTAPVVFTILFPSTSEKKQNALCIVATQQIAKNATTEERRTTKSMWLLFAATDRSFDE